MSEMLRLRFAGVRFEEAAVTFEAAFGRVRPARCARRAGFFGRSGAPQRKRFLALALFVPIAALLLILCSPVMVIVAIPSS